MLHFYILDILADGGEYSSDETADIISARYLSAFDDAKECDESTIRKKLNEYEKLGLLKAEKRGRKKLYALSADGTDVAALKDAAAFFSEADPLGVVGSYILDKFESDSDMFSFKHHYIMTAAESEILYGLLEAINRGAGCEMEMFSSRQKKLRRCGVLPIKIYVSTYNGRRYLMAWRFKFKEIAFYRLDKIKSVKQLDEVKDAEKYRAYAKAREKFLWGVSVNDPRHTEILEMTLRVEKDAGYIVERLEREKRGGTIERQGEDIYKFTAEVYDAVEMIPWIRTFTGRIVSVKCSNKSVEDILREDLRAMLEMYGAGGDEG